VAVDPIEIHRLGLAGSEALLIMLAASLLTLIGTRLYTRLARKRDWASGHVGEIHLHHLVVGIVLVLIAGMLDIAVRPGGLGRGLLAFAFGVGAAFVLDEFALSLHLRDVYWTPEGRHSLEACLMWALLGMMLLVGISPFGIHDQSEIPRAIGFGIVTVAIVLSVVTCLKGKLTLGLVSVFVPPVGVVSALRLARPGSVWAQLFYRGDEDKLARARDRFDPRHSRLERIRRRVADVLGGSHEEPPSDEVPELRQRSASGLR
jgi:hypothetical protein